MEGLSGIIGFVEKLLGKSLERFTFFRDGLCSLFAVAWPPPLTPAIWSSVAAVRVIWKVALACGPSAE